MGSKHRMYRHNPYTTPQEARLLFGALADQVCLDHIRLDQLESRGKGIKRTREPSPLGQAFASVFFGIVTLTLGLVMISTRYIQVQLFALPMFFLSFLLSGTALFIWKEKL